VSNFSESLAAGKFTITAEIGPPKGTNIQPVIHEAEEFLKNDKVAAVNVTDIQTAVMRGSSMVGAVLLRQAGIEPVLQMVWRPNPSTISTPWASCRPCPCWRRERIWAAT
jgi:5,10-methylenetetrahydrofolate reductase